jgi:hypothetical protein
MLNSIFANMTTIGDDTKGGGLQNFLRDQGYSNLTVDNWAGAQTMNALKDYIDREVNGRNYAVSDDPSHPTAGSTTLSTISITPKNWE